jgi:hypothetical protein
MAESKKPALGSVDEMVVRRIGLTHAVVVPPREAKLLDISQVRQTIAQIDRRLGALDAERKKLEALRADQSLIVTLVENAPIERIEGDPPVLVEKPQPDKPEADDAALEADAVTPKPTTPPRRG